NWPAEGIRIPNGGRARLREVKCEALVYRNLGFVRLNLAEVRIRGEVEHETVMQHNLRVQPERPTNCPVFEVRVIWIAVVEITKRIQQPVRNQLNIATRRDSLQAGHGGCLS